jgi:protein-tyrosine phosphatase
VGDIQRVGGAEGGEVSAATTIGEKLIPEDRWETQRGQSRSDLAIIYTAGAIACVVAGAIIGRWGWLLLWPATSLALVAVAYVRGSVDLFHKRDGRLSHSAWVVHWPYLIAQRISWRTQSCGRTACSELTPGIWIGRRPGRRDCEELKRRGVVSTLDLTAELSEWPGLRGEGYYNLPILDLTLPALATLERAAAIIAEASRHGGVYVHCAIGYGRTAVVAAAYLLASGRAGDVQSALEQVCAARRGSVFSGRAVLLLRGFTERRSSRY